MCAAAAVVADVGGRMILVNADVSAGAQPCQAVSRPGAAWLTLLYGWLRCFARRHDSSKACERVFLRATRDICKGEEVFASYGRTYWRLNGQQ